MKRKAMTSTSAILWGACMLIVGLIHLRFASYGGDFLRMMSSIYPGFHASRTFGDVLVGTCYGLADGAILGCVFSSLYRRMGREGVSQVKGTPVAKVVDPPLVHRRVS